MERSDIESIAAYPKAKAPRSFFWFFLLEILVWVVVWSSDAVETLIIRIAV